MKRKRDEEDSTNSKDGEPSAKKRKTESGSIPILSNPVPVPVPVPVKSTNKHFVNNSNCSTQVPLPPSTPMNCFNHCFYHVHNIYHMNAGKLMKSHSRIMNLMKNLKSIENPQQAHGDEQERSRKRSRCFGELQFWGKFEKNQSSVIKDFKF